MCHNTLSKNVNPGYAACNLFQVQPTPYFGACDPSRGQSSHSGGMNVAPREVEDLIATLPGIEAVAVVGLPDDRLCEIGCACVVLTAGTTLELADLVSSLKALGLAAYKLPERLAVLDALPRTPSGKVQKHVLVGALLPTT